MRPLAAACLVVLCPLWASAQSVLPPAQEETSFPWTWVVIAFGLAVGVFLARLARGRWPRVP